MAVIDILFQEEKTKADNYVNNAMTNSRCCQKGT